MSDLRQKLQAIRDQIDAIDEDLLASLNRRALLAKEVAQLKEDEEDNRDYYRPDREADVLHKLLESNSGPLSGEALAHLFREIMSACRALQRPMCIAFLGPEGTFTEAAALKHFGHAVETVPLESIDAVFREVESGASDYGVVPVENSTEGVVSHTLDMFVQSSLGVCGEVELRIHHHVLGVTQPRDNLQGILRLYSHQQSFAQCRQWLDLHMPGVERILVNSNADAAARASREPDSAAIAGEVAASVYGLELLAANIEDQPDNTTRFLVIGDRSVPPTGTDKTSLLLSSRNRPGALYMLLEPFARSGVSMTRIESRPARSGMWEYVFFVDIEGHVADSSVAKALKEIEEHASLFRVLGSYPRAVL